MEGPFRFGPAVERLRSLYRQQGWARLPGLLPPALAAAWEQCSRDLPLRPVHVDGPGGELWLEQGGPALQARLGRTFADPALRQRLEWISGLEHLDPRLDQLWINRYRPGNRVPTHRDVDGDTQLLLCLQGLPQPERGGDLVVEGQPVPLSSGDAVLFAASRLRHGTRRIEGSALPASGFSRVVLVLRLFAGPRDGGEGAPPQRLESGCKG